MSGGFISPDNPALPGSDLYSGKIMSFGDFVVSFCAKGHQNGNPWLAPEIVVETGMTASEVNAFLTYIQQKQLQGLTVEQISALLPVMSKTPFGLVLSDPASTTQPIASILSVKIADLPQSLLTVGDLVAVIKSA